MHKTIITVILLIACIGLAVALVVVKTQQSHQQQEAAQAIETFSNQLTVAQDQISGLNQVNGLLTNDLEASRITSSSLSNELDEAQAAITRAEQQATLAQEQVTNLAHEVKKLEAANAVLELNAAQLTNRLGQLDREIALTEASLSESQTNNVFLEDELKKQVAERTALEQKFSDLSVMKTQYHKLKDEALMTIRLKWMREGTDPSQQRKGGTLLTHNQRPPVLPRNSSLNVEVDSAGNVRAVQDTNVTFTVPPPR